MIETSEASTSKEAKLSKISSNAENSDIEMEDIEDNEDISSLWCIEDDTLFYAQGLKHHSAGKGKSVYVTWNENYLLNFVFKTSNKTGTTTLTKVRISLPIHDQEVEEISNMLILEMNTLLYMKSGRVYYFSSVKSMHKIDWLAGIRCMASCPLTQFSVIRLVNNCHHGEHDRNRILSLEVYKDVPQLGKCLSDNVLKHMYDISFDLENTFNCDWIDETYTLTSLITDERNIVFLKLLVSIGDMIRSQEQVIDLNMNQEIHIFTISGNIFFLVGAIVSESESTLNSQVENFTIRLLNTYACPIECVRVDCENNLLIVLLQSGHMDVWYESKRMFGALLHCQHEITHFLNYDFCPIKNIFYFTTHEEVIQLKIIKNSSTDVEKECIVKETRKNVGGMIACTFVEGLQQLICLSINNIFYRINFAAMAETREIGNKNETEYENLNHLYALNEKRLKDLAAKAEIIDDLMEQPKNLHHSIEKEFRKQQVLALETKREIFKKLFQCHIEYHKHLPGREYFVNDCVLIKAATHQSQLLNAQSICCLIFISLRNNKNNLLSSVFAAAVWYLHISNMKQSLQLHIPYEVVNKRLCFIIDVPMKDHVIQILPKLSVNLLTFYNHHCHSICLKYNLDLDSNENDYTNLFSFNLQNLQIYRNTFDDVANLLRKQPKIADNSITKPNDNIYALKHRYKIAKSALQYVMERVLSETSWSLGMVFKIYYLHQYLIELNYDHSNETLLMCTNYPIAMFYMKLLLIHAVKSYSDIDMVDTSVDSMSQIIMNYQCEIEHLYGSLISSASGDANSNTISMQLENLQKIYLKLRTEFYDILK